jgi:hypothetical protein
MEKKINELKLDELTIVAGGYGYSLPAATVYHQPTSGGLLSGATSTPQITIG